jgi:hypothetical protein
MNGDAAKSRKAYRISSPSGKTPTPGIPILKEAKAEYAKRALSGALTRRVKVPLASK